MSKLLRIYLTIFGALDFLALAVAFILSANVVIFYFSYFTVLSNILITILFLYFAYFRTDKLSKTLEWIYGAAVLYMTMTGLIYWTILVSNHSLSLDPWINLTLHALMPITALISWFLFPRRKKLVYRNALEWLIPPLLFVFSALSRGRYIDWYPYPFLNPVISGGYLQVGLNVSLLLSLFLIAGLLLIWINRQIIKK